MPATTVIVPARDAAATLPATLEGIGDQRTSRPFEVIVVDNGSQDGTAELAARAPVVQLVIRRDRGAGPGEARNSGAAAARGEVLAFLDADCVPAPGWLDAGLRALTQADLVQGRVRPDPAAVPGPFDRTLVVEDAHGLFESANLFVRRDLFERVGGFPSGLEEPSVAAPFGEDVRFGWRATRAGAVSRFCGEALVYHAVEPRGPFGYVAERRRRELFPALVHDVPELRDGFLYRRLFLDRRTAAFDLAVVAAGAAWRRHRLAAFAAAPYVWQLAGHARRWGRRQVPRVVAVELLADVVGAAALTRGSLSARSPVL